MSLEFLRKINDSNHCVLHTSTCNRCYFRSCTFIFKCNRLYLVSIKVTVMDKYIFGSIAMFCVCGRWGRRGEAACVHTFTPNVARY